MQYGHFDTKAHEYVIDKPDIPVSWKNYLGVRDLCTVLSHNAGGYSFYKNAEHHRITRFRPNSLPLDRPGHYVYLRDDTSGDFWSLSWQPAGKPLDTAAYKVRHGLSYSAFECTCNNIHAQQLMFIPVDDDVELWDVTLTNNGNTPRSLSIFSYLEFSFHHIEIDNQNLQMSLYASGTSYKDGIIEYDFFYEPWTFHFFTSNFEPDSYDCTRDEFIGKYRTETNPLAVEKGSCTNSSELGGNHCGSLHKKIHLEPGETKRVVFMLGVGSRKDKGYEIKNRYSDTTAVDQAFEKLRAYWHDKQSRFICSTPNTGLDVMTNTWTLFQAETCVVWSRFASFIEVGGRTGLGYRDTAQDIMGAVHSNPEKCRQRIEELLHGHTSAGYGLHLFDPEVFSPHQDELPGVKLPTVVPAPSPSDIIHGIEDVCADDALWLIASVCEWVKETGNISFFDVQIPYADSGTGTVYEHLRKILDFALDHRGPNGICQGLRADWNDCLNLGGGESSMVSFMLHWVLNIFIEAARYLGRQNDVDRYTSAASDVKTACEKMLWDGQWYLRGFTKNQDKIGTRQAQEGQLFLNAQTWAVISGVAPKDRAVNAMDAVDKHLFSQFGLHLLWPSFSSPDDDIGYVTRVYKGIKENGSIFSHPNPWAVIAEAILGRGTRAMKFYNAILPYNQNDCIEIREAEPYSYCQFIYGKDHKKHGRARHPWLTGTAGWFYTAVTKYILGIQITYDSLVIDPCIPAEWEGFTITRKWRGATYNITVKNPHNIEKGVASVTIDGKTLKKAVPVQEKNSTHHIEVIMG